MLTGVAIANPKAHQACVRDVSWHPEVNEIVTSSWDGMINHWRYYGEPDEIEAEANSNSDSGTGFKESFGASNGNRRRTFLQRLMS